MHHQPAIAPRGQPLRGHRAIREVEVGGAGVLFQAEGHLELAGLDLGNRVLAVVDEDVAPGVDVIADLPLDLEVEDVPDRAVDADPAAREVVVVRVSHLALRPAQIALQPESKIEPDIIAQEE